MIGFIVIVSGLAFLMLLERIFPDQKLKKVSGWWQSVIMINIYQLFLVIVAIFTWEK